MFYKKIKPIYRDVSGDIFCGDCLEVLSGINEKFDFVIADFPYYISKRKNSLTKIGNNIVPAKFGDWDISWKTEEDYIKWVFEVHKVVYSKIKEESSLIYFFSNLRAGWFAYEFERNGLGYFKMPIIWKKVNPLPHIRKTGFRGSFEECVWLIKSNEKEAKSKVFNFLSQNEMKNIWEYSIGKKETKHPTEKPIVLLEKLIKIFTNEGGLILDLFSGSGNCAVACKQLNRRFVSIEKEEEYCKNIVNRIKNLNIQKNLF